MSKPEDIPADIRSAAWDLGMALLGPDTASDEDLGLIARAIMAEREACAVLASDRWKQWGHKNQDQLWRVDVASCTEIAAAIRKRGEG